MKSKVIKGIITTIVCMSIGAGSICSYANTMDMVKVGTQKVLQNSASEVTTNNDVMKLVKTGSENIIKAMQSNIVVDGNTRKVSLKDLAK